MREQWLAWVEAALDDNFRRPTDEDLMALHHWLVSNSTAPPPMPRRISRIARQTMLSVRVMAETKDWTPAQYRKALVEARMRW